MGQRGAVVQTACVKFVAGCVFSVSVVTSHSAAQAQSPTIRLDPINVEGTRSGSSPQGQDGQQGAGGQQESAYGPVQGYVATRSATGTKTDTPLKETPQSVTVVTADQIKDQGAKTVQESLRYVPGAFADAYGPDTRGDYPRVRGSDPNIYLDGTQAVNAWQFNEWRPDPYTLSRIEVLRGPSSVLYGATSTAGIINLVSKLPQAESYREIGVQYGSFNRKQIHTDMTGKLTPDGEWLYRLIGVFRDSDFQTDYVKDDRVLVQPAITWKPGNDTTWTLMGFYQKDKTGSSNQFMPHEGTLFPGRNGTIPVNRFAGTPGFDRNETESASVSSLFEHRFSDNFKVRQNTRYLHTDGIDHITYPNTYSSPVSPNPHFPFTDATRQSVYRYIWMKHPTRNSLTSDTHAEFNFLTGPVSHKVLTGFDYRMLTDRGENGFAEDLTPFNLYAPVYHSITPPPLTPYAGTRQRQSGFYIQDQMRLGQWIAVAGVRRDRLESELEGEPNQHDAATTGRVGLMYELPGGLTPYVSWAQSFNPIFGANVCVDGYCKPKTGELKEVGFKYNPWAGLAVNAALYDITEENRESYNNGDPEFRATQTGKVRIRGGEIEVIGSITRDIDIIAAYSYTDAKVVEGDFPGSRLETVPLHQASLWAKHRFSLFGMPGFVIGAGARYVGESWATGMSPYTSAVETITTPSYMLYDAMFGYENDKWRFQVNAMNLTDKTHVTTCLINGRGDCFYGQSRTVLGSLTYKF
jgi:iron complex outermembrane receptor protein